MTSHKAITAQSTPLCRSSMAAEWRRTCGVTVYVVAKGSVGRPLQHTWPRDRRLRRDSRALPPRIGKTGASRRLCCSRCHACNTATVSLRSGVQRVLRPLPRQCTWAPVRKTISCQRRPINSDTRSPFEVLITTASYPSSDPSILISRGKQRLDLGMRQKLDRITRIAHTGNG